MSFLSAGLLFLPWLGFFRLPCCQCSLQYEMSPRRHHFGRLHGFIGRALETQAPSLALGLIGEAFAFWSFKHGTGIRAGLNLELIALPQVGQQSHCQPVRADAVASQYLPCRAWPGCRQPSLPPCLSAFSQNTPERDWASVQTEARADHQCYTLVGFRAAQVQFMLDDDRVITLLVLEAEQVMQPA